MKTFLNVVCYFSKFRDGECGKDATTNVNKVVEEGRVVVAQLVERSLLKLEVHNSTPVIGKYLYRTCVSFQLN